MLFSAAIQNHSADVPVSAFFDEAAVQLRRHPLSVGSCASWCRLLVRQCLEKD